MNEEQRKRLEENRASNARAAEKKAAADAIKAKRQDPANRLRDSYREDAERRNPNPAATVYDSHGRPREPSDNHAWLGRERP